MNHQSVLIMIIASIIIGYYFSMTVLLTRNKTDNLQKVYFSLLMGVLMGIVELLMLNHNQVILLLILLLLAIILTYLIQQQIGINERQFMLAMIEHHEMALVMSKKVKPKVTNPKLKHIVDEILESQQREIDLMHSILNEKTDIIN